MGTAWITPWLLQPERALIQLELAERLGIVQCFSIAGRM
jgi:hypothetical protein